MSAPDTVPVFVVVAESGGKRHELGLFFTEEDAEKHRATLKAPAWGNARVEPQDMPLTDVHPAHRSLLTPEQRGALDPLSVFHKNVVPSL